MCQLNNGQPNTECFWVSVSNITDQSWQQLGPYMTVEGSIRDKTFLIWWTWVNSFCFCISPFFFFYRKWLIPPQYFFSHQKPHNLVIYNYRLCTIHTGKQAAKFHIKTVNKRTCCSPTQTPMGWFFFYSFRHLMWSVFKIRSIGLLPTRQTLKTAETYCTNLDTAHLKCNNAPR